MAVWLSCFDLRIKIFRWQKHIIVHKMGSCTKNSDGMMMQWYFYNFDHIVLSQDSARWIVCKMVPELEVMILELYSMQAVTCLPWNCSNSLWMGFQLHMARPPRICLDEDFNRWPIDRKWCIVWDCGSLWMVFRSHVASFLFIIFAQKYEQVQCKIGGISRKTLRPFFPDRWWGTPRRCPQEVWSLMVDSKSFSEFLVEDRFTLYGMMKMSVEDLWAATVSSNSTCKPLFVWMEIGVVAVRMRCSFISKQLP